MLGILSGDRNIATERNRVKADVVVGMVDTNDPKIAGLAVLKANSSSAFATVEAGMGSANTNRTFSHEIGHLIGLNHDVEVSPSLKPYKYGHGYKINDVARSIMAYECSNNSCPWKGVFSNPDVNFPGTNWPSGTNSNTLICNSSSNGYCSANNASVIRQRAKAVSMFK